MGGLFLIFALYFFLATFVLGLQLILYALKSYLKRDLESNQYEGGQFDPVKALERLKRLAK